MVWKVIFLAGCWAIYWLDPSHAARGVADGVTIGVLFCAAMDLGE